MNTFELFTDSSCDLSADLIKQLDLHILELEVTVDDRPPVPNSALDIKGFYADLRAGKTAKTNAAGPEAFKNLMESYTEKGCDILYIGFSSGLSATYNNGRLAMQTLQEKYPDCKLLAVDSLCASMGQGLIVYYAAKMREQGATIEEVYAFVEQNRLHLCHQFTVDDLFFLKRGGRVNAATAIAGTMLGIKPVLHVDDQGHLINISKARGRKASILALLQKMKETALTEKYKTVFISHGDCIEDAQYLAELVEAEFHPDQIVIGDIGPVIGAHSGPGTLALFYYGSER